jgi:nuclear transport factor 2 (NTF2) superfamily protein
VQYQKTLEFRLVKKCSTTVENQVAYSYVWLYNKESGLEADKSTCEKLK